VQNYKNKNKRYLFIFQNLIIFVGYYNYSKEKEMKANTSTIYMQDWLALHPYNRMAETDQYYIDIANDILKIIISRPPVLA